jgi:predicted pyridoxine 5'-phosphate oxidase superfamily flavin-nucleotide-binding protein
MITDDLRAFLARIDTAALATASKDGEPYVQHRGGPPGFIRALDDETLGFVDFIGNRQYITAGNLAENDRVCLLAIDYATGGRVKIWGRARRVELTDELRERLADPTYRGRPDRALLISVTRWDVNCRQHIPRKMNVSSSG